MGGACRALGGGKKCVQNFVRKLRGKRPFGIHGRRREENLEVGLREVGFGSMDWISLVEDRDRCRALVRRLMNSGIP
jgi:hypothetical protein